MKTIDPTTYRPLASFSCGNGSDSAREADEIVGQLVRGETTGATVRVAEHPETDALMAISARVPRPLLPDDGRPFADDATMIAIGLLGVDHTFHGTLLPGGAMSLGEFMVLDVLRGVAQEHPEGMPPVWALVGHDNKPALRLCEAYGFELQSMTESHRIAYRQPETASAC